MRSGQTARSAPRMGCGQQRFPGLPALDVFYSTMQAYARPRCRQHVLLRLEPRLLRGHRLATAAKRHGATGVNPHLESAAARETALRCAADAS